MVLKRPSCCLPQSLLIYLRSGWHSETSKTLVQLDDKNFRKALERFVSDAGDTLSLVFEKAFRKRKQNEIDNYQILVQALGSFGQEGATKSELLAKIRKTAPKYPAANLNHCLKKLAEEERGSLVRHSTSSGKYSFADPIFRAYVLTRFKEERSPTGPAAYFLDVLPTIPRLPDPKLAVGRI